MEDNINIEIKKVDGVVIFKLLEKSFDASIAGLVKGELTVLLSADDVQKLVFDLSEVEYCDSSGLSAILLAFRMLQTNEGQIRLAAPQKSVKSLIQISQLDRVLPIKNSVEEAVNELKRDLRLFVDKTLDYLIIIAFLIGVALFGIFKGGKQNTVEDYFLGSKNVPWWAVMFSIVAAETSTLTFISIPGLAYLTNLNFLQVTFGYLIGRIIIAVFFLPSYFTGELNTAYAFLENRFGQKTRSFSSIVFLFTRTAADGVRLFATAIPLKLMLGIDYTTAIVIIAIITLAYTITGGVKGIIWVDVILMGIYLGGALLAGYFLVSHYLPDGFNSIITAAQADDKLSIINLGFNSGSIAEFFAQPYTLISGLLGGAFLSMASHGTDQLIVQRLLSTQNLKQAQKAIVGSGIIVIFQFVIFLVVGVALYAFYGKLNLRSDEVFPKFIIESLPTPYSGIIIAGLFAAAMSTLAGSISALSSSTMLDLYQPFKKNRNKNNDLKVSRMFTIFWAIMLIFAALFFMNSPQTVVELALSIASFTYGGLLGTFMLGLFVKNAKQEDALAAFTGGIFVMVTVISLQLVAWTWFTIIGVAATLLIGTFLSYLSNNKI